MATFEKRKDRNGKESVRVKIRIKGLKKPVSITCPNLTIARQKAAEIETEVRAGRYTRTIEARRHTVAEAIDRYCRDVLPEKSKAMQHQRVQLEEWRKEIGHLTLDQLTAQVLCECRDKFRNVKTQNGPKREASTVNRLLAPMSHLLSVAVNEWEWLEVSPMRKVKRLKESRGRVRWLTDDERERLLTAVDQSECKSLGLITRMALATGMRKTEIASLCWDDIDLLSGKVLIHQTKNGHRRATFVSGITLEQLKSHSKVRRLHTNLVFPSPSNAHKPLNFHTSWLNAVRKAKIDNLKFHDLRHEFATRLAEQGASLAQLSEALGHRTLNMVKRYSHLTENSIQDIVAEMNQRMFGKL
ncbi:MAG: site-specific integrase [Bdellovibrionota bacterium]